jgi:YYY domain-containing protein
VVDSNDALTINEFPSFSFILGDLHPHVMALPFTIVCLTIAFGLWLRGREERDEDPLKEYGPLALAGVVIGSLYPLNSWDFPTYLAAAVTAILLAYGWRRGAFERIIVLGVASVIAWSPFWLSFVPFAGGSDAETSSIPVIGRIASTIGAYRGERTSAGEFLTIFGIPWAIACVLLGVELAKSLRGHEVSVPRWAALPGILLAIVALGLPAPVLILAGLPFAASIWLISRRDESDIEQTAIATLCAAGFGLILLTEFFYIQDVFAGRLNTLFKVYYQVWTLLGIAAAIAVIRLWRSTSLKTVHATIAAATMLTLALGVSYPIVSAHGWIDFQGPNGWSGLDGAEFVGDTDPDDLAAVHWLAENAKEDDVVLEAAGCSYEENFGVPTGPLATYTGVPTVIGWAGHERQWRAGQPDLMAEILLRADEVARLYANPNDTELLDRYGITLLYVGRFERDGSSGCDLAGPYPSVLEEGYPGDGWTEIFASGDARIYRRVG